MALAELGRIDLFKNAGYADSGLPEESPIEQVRALFDTNFLGMVRVTNEVLSVKHQQGHGWVLNIGSVVGLRGCLGIRRKRLISGGPGPLLSPVRSYLVKAVQHRLSVALMGVSGPAHENLRIPAMIGPVSASSSLQNLLVASRCASTSLRSIQSVLKVLVFRNLSWSELWGDPGWLELP